MEVLKKILIGLGALFFLFIVLVVFLIGSSSDFQQDYEPFTKQFLADLSINWDKSNVIQRMSNSLIEDLSDEETMNSFRSLKGLGSLESFGDITMDDYTTQSGSGESAVFTLSTNFKAGHVLWKISVNVKDDKPRVTGIHLVSFEGEMIEEEEVVETSA